MKHQRPEFWIQVEVVAWLKNTYPDVLFTISPQGMKLQPWVARDFKLLGYRSGTPDILIFEAQGIYHGLLVEIKSEKGIVSDEQLLFHAQAKERGYKIEVCWSIEESKTAIKNYLQERN